MIDPATLPLLPLHCDWRARVVTRLHTASTVEAGETGAEQRTGRRWRASLSIAFEAAARGGVTEARWSEIVQRAMTATRAAIPIWPDQVEVTGSVTGGVVPVATGALANRWYQAGRGVLLWRSPLVYGVAAVATGGVGASALTLAAEPEGSFGRGDLLVPLLVSRPLTEEQRSRWSVPSFARSSHDLAEDPAEALDLPWSMTSPAARTLPVFPFPWNWTTPPATAWDRSAITQMSRSGLTDYYRRGDLPAGTTEAVISLRDRASLARLQSLFAGRLGQLRPFWLPSGKRDFALWGNSGDNKLTVGEVGYTANEFAKLNRKMLLITTASNWYVRKVEAATLDPELGLEELTIDGTVPVLPASAELSLLSLARFATDDLELDWVTPTHAQASLRLRELVDEVGDYLAGQAPATGTIGGDGELRP